MDEPSPIIFYLPSAETPRGKSPLCFRATGGRYTPMSLWVVNPVVRFRKVPCGGDCTSLSRALMPGRCLFGALDHSSTPVLMRGAVSCLCYSPAEGTCD